jgi:hypothetical protein
MAKPQSCHRLFGTAIEERAKHVGLSTEYRIVYRNFSRNIHNTDYMEHLAERGATDIFLVVWTAKVRSA